MQNRGGFEVDSLVPDLSTCWSLEPRSRMCCEFCFVGPSQALLAKPLLRNSLGKVPEKIWEICYVFRNSLSQIWKGHYCKTKIFGKRIHWPMSTFLWCWRLTTCSTPDCSNCSHAHSIKTFKESFLWGREWLLLLKSLVIQPGERNPFCLLNSL